MASTGADVVGIAGGIIMSVKPGAKPSDTSPCHVFCLLEPHVQHSNGSPIRMNDFVIDVAETMVDGRKRNETEEPSS